MKTPIATPNATLMSDLHALLETHGSVAVIEGLRNCVDACMDVTDDTAAARRFGARASANLTEAVANVADFEHWCSVTLDMAAEVLDEMDACNSNTADTEPAPAVPEAPKETDS